MTKDSDSPPPPSKGDTDHSYSYGLMNTFLNAVFARSGNGTGTGNIPLSNKLKELRRSLSTSNSYTFVVPTTEVLEWSVDKDTLLPFRDLFLQDDCLLSHIIQIPQSSRNNQRARYYPTVNGKTVIVKDGYVHTHKGFNKYVRSGIVREYVFYPSCDFLPINSQFLVYEVESPLIGSPIPSTEVSPTLSSKYELAIPLKGSTSNITAPLSIANTAPANLERMLSAYTILNRQVLGPMLVLIEEFECSNCTSEDELLAMFDSVTEESIQIFKHGDANSIQSMARDNDLTGDDISDSIYRFVETSLSEQLWNKLIEIREEADSNLSLIIDTIKYIDISQIGLPDDFTIKELFSLDKKVWIAAKELRKLTELSSAEDKIEVILSVLHILSSTMDNDNMTVDRPTKEVDNETTNGTVNGAVNGNTANKLERSKSSTISSPNVNADVLVSLLLVVVCRSGLQYLDTHLFYVRNFSYRDSESGQLGYALLTLEGVLFHIVNEGKSISPLSKMNYNLWQFIKDSADNASNDLSIYLHTLSKEQPAWQSIVRSKSPSGESSLMVAVQSKNLEGFRTLLQLEENIRDNNGDESSVKIFSNDYLFHDCTDDGTTLLIAAVQTEDKQIISEVLNLIMRLGLTQCEEYLSLTDNWNRSVGHYFFHAPWLIEKIGDLISWEQRDQNGQTPLFALCRSYDHADYDSLMACGFKAWSKSVSSKRPGEHPSILDHIDNKGNTLLHIVKDRHAVEQVLKYDVDVNWPNEKGLTPLMVYSKYSRLSAILSLSHYPLIDLERTDSRGLNALDLAKEMQTLTILDGEYIQSSGGKYAQLTKQKSWHFPKNLLMEG